MDLKFIHVFAQLGSAFFFLIDSIPLESCITVCLHIHLSDILVALFWVVMNKDVIIIWTSVFLCVEMVSYKLGKYLEVQWLDYIVELGLAFLNTAKFSSKGNVVNYHQ